MLKRSFNSLGVPVVDYSDCVCHLSVFLCNNGARREGNAFLDFLCIKKNIELLKTQKISAKDGFKMMLVISINGDIQEEEYIKFFKEINNNIIGNNIHVIVFQRPNIGFQWGGFHDVWLRYQSINCDWYMTVESDVYFKHDTWFDYFIEKMAKNQKTGFLGQYQDLALSSLEKHIPLTCYDYECWRNTDNKIYKPTQKELQHTRGGFYFCRKEFLQKMDAAFGCFTHSFDHDYFYDGVLAGEVGFSQKANVLNYPLFNDEDIAYVRERNDLLLQ